MINRYYRNGLGAASGDPLVTSSQTYVFGATDTPSKVVYLHHTGSDANSGYERQRPKATLADCVALLGVDIPYIIIICIDGHTETITDPIDIAYNVSIVGEGSSGGLPTVEFTAGVDGAITVEDCIAEFRNIGLRPSAGNMCLYSVAASYISLESCALYAGVGTAVVLDVDYITLEACSIINDTGSAMPTPVMLLVDHPRGVGNIMKSGSGGFGTSSPDVFALRNDSATALWRFEGTTQNGGDIGTNMTSTGYIQVPVATGSSYIATDYEGGPH